MGHQYYKILSIHGEKDIFEDSNGNYIYLRPDAFEYIEKETLKGKVKTRTLRQNINLEEYSTCGHSFYTHILEKCLDTEYITNELYKNKKLNLKDIHPKKKTSPNESFLGYSDAFINVKLNRNSRSYLYSDTGFYCNGKKYVRYRRSASSAKSGNCLFIYEPLKNAMDSWNHCGLQIPSNSSALTSWEAYTALTLSGIQAFFQVSRKSILIVRDLTSSFVTPAIEVTKKKNDQNKEILSAEYSDSVSIKNTIWDGEALIDESVFSLLTLDGFSDSCMLLLRNRFFKSCGFRTVLQDQYDENHKLIRKGWFSDNGITSVKSLNGYTTAKKIEDIKIVITESSLKYLKFGSSKDSKPEQHNYESHQAFVEAYNAYLGLELQSWFAGLGNSHKLTFGIVKADKPSRFFKGTMVHTNYQLLNTLGLNEDETRLLLKDTLEYIEMAKNDPAVFRFYLENGLTLSLTSNDSEQEDTSEDMDFLTEDANADMDEYSLFKNDEMRIEENDSLSSSIFNYYNYQKRAVQQLLSISDNAFNTQLCAYVQSKLMEDAKKQISKGRFLIPGSYAILFGNPIELLCSIINKDYILPSEPSDVSVNGVTFPVLKDNEIYCSLFDAGEELCCARSPHITMGNLFLGINTNLKNQNNESIIDKYFTLSNQIVCVNSINHNLLEKLNGADFDSDTMLVTNHNILIEALKRQGDLFPVPTLVKNDIESTVNSSSNKQSRWDTLTEIDNLLSTNIVGHIVHCSQELNSILWTRFPGICRVDQNTYTVFEKSYTRICDLINEFLYQRIDSSYMLQENVVILGQQIRDAFTESELKIFENKVQSNLDFYINKQLSILKQASIKANTISDTTKRKTLLEKAQNNFRINLSEYIFTKMYSKDYIERYNYIHFENEIYNNICILEVLSNLEIDKAKRVYIENTIAAFNVVKEIKQIYQLQWKDTNFVLPAMPDYLINLKKRTNQSKTNQTRIMKTLVNKTKEQAVHETTLQYIYKIAMNDITRAGNKKIISLSSILNPIDGKRHHSDDFDRIKIIAAYYYLKIRTCHNISNNGKTTPDFGKCAFYVKECFKEISTKILNNNSFEPSFMIYSLIAEIDEHQNSKQNTLTIESIFNQINSWSDDHKRNIIHASDFIELVSSVDEANKLRCNPKKKIKTETFSRLLIAALCNILYENSVIRNALISPSSEPIKQVHFNDNGDFSIYGHKCNIY